MAGITTYGGSHIRLRAHGKGQDSNVNFIRNYIYYTRDGSMNDLLAVTRT